MSRRCELGGLFRSDSPWQAKWAIILDSSLDSTYLQVEISRVARRRDGGRRPLMAASSSPALRFLCPGVMDIGIARMRSSLSDASAADPFPGGCRFAFLANLNDFTVVVYDET